MRSRSELGVEVVVHGESADFEAVGDVFDSLAECERSELVESPHDVLFPRAIETRDGCAELPFDLVDQAVEGPLQPAGPESADNGPFPSKGKITIAELTRRNDLTAEGEREWLDGLQELLHLNKTSPRVLPPTPVAVAHI